MRMVYSILKFNNHINNYFKFCSTMVKPHVYITRSDVPSSVIQTLKETCEVTMWHGPDAIPKKELVENIKDKDGLFCFLTDRVDKTVLQNANCLKVIGTMSVGYDHIDISESKKRNIQIGYTPDILTDATAELTLALLLATSRRLYEANQQVRTGGWKSWAPFWMCGPGLANKTVGIVGFGRIGQQVARLIKPFNVHKLIFYNRSEKSEDAAKIGAVQVDFDVLLGESDFVIVTCALSEQTRGLFSDGAFSKMKNSAILINTSRGAVVDETALIAALKTGQIAAAGLDVMEKEPLPLDSPLINLENCFLLPHIGSATNEARYQMALMTADNILCALNNQNMPAEIK